MSQGDAVSNGEAVDSNFIEVSLRANSQRLTQPSGDESPRRDKHGHVIHPPEYRRQCTRHEVDRTEYVEERGVDDRFAPTGYPGMHEKAEKIGQRGNDDNRRLLRVRAAALIDPPAKSPAFLASLLVR